MLLGEKVVLVMLCYRKHCGDMRSDTKFSFTKKKNLCLDFILNLYFEKDLLKFFQYKVL